MILWFHSSACAGGSQAELSRGSQRSFEITSPTSFCPLDLSDGDRPEHSAETSTHISKASPQSFFFHDSFCRFLFGAGLLLCRRHPAACWDLGLSVPFQTCAGIVPASPGMPSWVGNVDLKQFLLWTSRRALAAQGGLALKDSESIISFLKALTGRPRHHSWHRWGVTRT